MTFFVKRLLVLSNWPPLALATRLARVVVGTAGDAGHRLRDPRRTTREGLLGKDKDEKEENEDTLFSLLAMTAIWLLGMWYFASFLVSFFVSSLPPAQPGDEQWFKDLFPHGVPDVIIVTPIIFNNGTPPHVERTQANHAVYAEKHGYGLVALTKEMVPNFAHANEMLTRPRHPVWYKITGALFILRLLRNFAPDRRPWVWLLDSDVVFTNMSIGLLDALPKLESGGYKMALTKDGNGLNAGSWVLAGEPWSEWLLDKVWKNEVVGSLLREQEALKRIHENDRDVIFKTLIVQQHKINAYPSDYWDKIETRFSRPWKQGDLLVHFPNCDGYQPPRPNCTERTRYYLLSDAEREAEDKASGAADEWEVRQKVAAAVAGVGS